MKILPELALTYDDVLLVPQYSNVDSRRVLSTRTCLTKKIALQIPIVAANMDVVTESEMAITMAREGGITKELHVHWEIISEGAQTILRAAGRSDAYESLKSQTRGQTLSAESYRAWIASLDIDEETHARLLGLSPESYIGLAIQLVDEVIR